MGPGFLTDHSTFMLDVVVCALVLLVPLLAWSLYLVKVRRNFVAHRNLQVTLGAVLLVTVVLFEIDIRLHGGWKQIVQSRPDPLSPAEFTFVERLLYTHLVFAISTPLLWAATLSLAWQRFPNPPQPTPHSRLHKTLGWLSTADLALTSLTGLVFYYFAFVG